MARRLRLFLRVGLFEREGCATDASGDGIARSEVAVRVLLVNCAEHEREMYAEYLRYAGIETVEACGVSDAVNIAGTFRPDVVVTALSLPHESHGFDLIRRLKMDPALNEVAVIVVTGRVFDADREQAMDAGCDIFLPKPLLPDVLAHEVRRAAAGRARALIGTRNPSQ